MDKQHQVPDESIPIDSTREVEAILDWQQRYIRQMKKTSRGIVALVIAFFASSITSFPVITGGFVAPSTIIDNLTENSPVFLTGHNLVILINLLIAVSSVIAITFGFVVGVKNMLDIIFTQYSRISLFPSKFDLCSSIASPKSTKIETIDIYISEAENMGRIIEKLDAKYRVGMHRCLYSCGVLLFALVTYFYIVESSAVSLALINATLAVSEISKHLYEKKDIPLEREDSNIPDFGIDIGVSDVIDSTPLAEERDGLNLFGSVIFNFYSKFSLLLLPSLSVLFYAVTILESILNL